jgi:hypothetical protein
LGSFLLNKNPTKVGTLNTAYQSWALPLVVSRHLSVVSCFVIRTRRLASHGGLQQVTIDY